VTEVGVVKVGVHGRCTECVVDELALHEKYCGLSWEQSSLH